MQISALEDKVRVAETRANSAKKASRLGGNVVFGHADGTENRFGGGSLSPFGPGVSIDDEEETIMALHLLGNGNQGSQDPSTATPLAALSSNQPIGTPLLGRRNQNFSFGSRSELFFF